MSQSARTRLHHLLLGLGLVAILSGTLARQAEAAADFARTMAELGEGDRVEEEDGGVGDDAFEAPKGDASQSPAADLAPWDAAPGLGAALLAPPPRPARRAEAPPFPGDGAPPGRKHAWLQRFLF